MGFHLFRHTHASMMLNAGTNWKELQHRMGHKSITTTMDTYAELAPKKNSKQLIFFWINYKNSRINTSLPLSLPFISKACTLDLIRITD